MAIADQQKSNSLLRCLKESLECEICFEPNELRLLPCQHMMCLQCLVGLLESTQQEIDIISETEKKKYECPFCRSELHLQPEEYPVCRLARDFQQQVHQLQKALERRRSTMRQPKQEVRPPLALPKTETDKPNNNSRRYERKSAYENIETLLAKGAKLSDNIHRVRETNSSDSRLTAGLASDTEYGELWCRPSNENTDQTVYKNMRHPSADENAEDLTVYENVKLQITSENTGHLTANENATPPIADNNSGHLAANENAAPPIADNNSGYLTANENVERLTVYENVKHQTANGNTEHLTVNENAEPLTAHEDAARLTAKDRRDDAENTTTASTATGAAAGVDVTLAETEREGESSGELCHGSFCTSTELLWFCGKCCEFFCNRCTSSNCKIGLSGSKHDLMYIEDAVENSIEHFENFKRKLQADIARCRQQENGLKSVIAKHGSRSVSSTLTDNIRELNEQQKACLDKIKTSEEQLNNIRHAVTQLSDIEYIKVANWLFESGELC